MPVYEYICLKCDERFSILHIAPSQGQEARCPRCNSDEVKKVLSAFSCSSSEGTTFSGGPSAGSGFSGGG